MARLLVRAIDGYQHPDLEKRDAGNYLKGYVVSHFEDGHVFGTKETLPNFVAIDVPEVPRDQFIQYGELYNRSTQCIAFSSKVSTDTYRCDLSTTNKTVGGKGFLTKKMTEKYLNLWGGSVVSANRDRVRFDISVFKIATSNGVWGTGFPLTFTEVSYLQVQGVHKIQAVYDNAPVSQKQMTKTTTILARVGFVLLSNDPGKVVFETTREITGALFRSHIKGAIDSPILRRKYCISTSLVDQAVANGGALEVSLPTLKSFIKDLSLE